MKKFIILLLAVALAACSAPATPTEQPVVAPPEPTSTPVVVVQTVVVEATQVPTEPPPPTEPPTSAPVVVTVVVQPTQAPAEAAPTQAPAQSANNTNAPIMVDDTLGAGWFVNMTRTGSNLSLRCQLYKDITFSVKPTDPSITEVDFYYRIEDRKTGAIFDWQNAGRMLPDTNGNFVLTFSGEDVKSDYRKATAWFDYQFVGISRLGGRVGNSEKIVQQVDYSNDCP